MYKQLEALDAPLVEVRIHGRGFAAPNGMNLAAFMLLHGLRPFRTTPVSAAPREPFCMMGVCFECLAEVDGVPNTQTCLIPIRAGMSVEIQHGARSLSRNRVPHG